MPLQHQEHETGHGQTPTASSRDHKLLRLNREPFSLAVRRPPGGGFGREERFGLRRLKGRCRLGQPTFAGTLGNARDVPIPELAVLLHNLDGFDSKQPMGNSERRWGEAPKFTLDQLGEGDRRAVFEIAPDDLNTDRQPFGALANRHRRRRQPDKYRDPGPDALVVIRHLDAVDVELAAKLR